MHEQFVALGIKLIAQNGRTVQLVSYENSGDAWNPDKTEVLTQIKAVQTKFKSFEIDETLIKSGDILYLSGSRIEPTVDHKILDEGNYYSIINVVKTKPGETAIIYKIQARA